MKNKTFDIYQNLLRRSNCKNDRQLARVLGVHHLVIHKLKAGGLSLTTTRAFQIIDKLLTALQKREEDYHFLAETHGFTTPNPDIKINNLI